MSQRWIAGLWVVLMLGSLSCKASQPSETPEDVMDVSDVAVADSTLEDPDTEPVDTTPECTTAATCPDTGEETACRVRACIQGQCGVVDLPEGQKCSDPGFNGECDGQGTCVPAQSCTTADECPGRGEPCRLPACVNEFCGFVGLPQGQSCSVGGTPAQCDGEGACRVPCATSCDCPETQSCNAEGYCAALEPPESCVDDCECPSGQSCVEQICQ